jgi:hypothetical protein
VSSELIRLMHGPTLPPEPCVVPPGVAPETPTVAPAAQAPANCRLSLRIDGGRQLTFSGMPICESALRQVVSDQCGFESSVTAKVRLFRTENDHILGHVSVTPDEGLSARPVYRAADLWSAEDLLSLLDTAIEDACFGATPPERSVAASLLLVCSPPRARKRPPRRRGCRLNRSNASAGMSPGCARSLNQPPASMTCSSFARPMVK